MSKCRFGLFEFDFRSGELRRDDQIVKLSPQPARVLAALLERPGEVVLREELRARLWGEETFVDFERGLNFCILQVRAALGDSSDNPRFVQTVPRKGYRFIAPVAMTSVLPAAPPSSPGDLRPAAPPPSPPPATSVLPPRRWLLGVAAAVILAPVVWLVFSGRPSAPAAQASDRIRIAVLPFVNLTGDPTVDYLADGLTDEVISQLGRLGPHRLAVIARTSAMSYRNTTKAVAQIGRELNAAYIVESSLRREGDALRIGSSLVPTGDESPTALWSETFGGNRASAADSQTGAAIRLARLIALELAPEGHTPELRRPTTNLAAWNQLMHGRALMNRGGPDDVKQAIAAFESAVRHDATMAAGWAKLAEARHLLVMMGAVAPNDAYPLAQQAGEQALAADPNLPDAHVAQGLVHLWYNQRPVDAAASFTRALALNASHAAALHDYAWALVALGRDSEAVTYITAARDIDPLSVRANNDIGWLYLHLRQPAEAMRACQHTLAIHADSLEAQACLERAYVQRGMDDAALRVARATLPPDTGLVLRPGDEADPAAVLQKVWRWRLARLETLSKTRWVSPYTLATHLAMVGEKARAIDQLEAARDERVGMLVFLGRDPAVDPLRGEPRFQALLARISETAP